MNSIFTDFLVTCSGANKDIIKQCPTEYTKFTGIGATILLTAFMAVVSGGYAIYFVFSSLSVSVVFGIFWGIIIFNLDRYIVSSIKKTGVFKEEFLFALPRLFIALVLAVSISKPLELRLFENRIAKQMDKNNKAYVDDYDNGFKSDIQKLNDQQKNLDDDLIKKKEDIFSKDPQYSKLKEKKTPLDRQKQNIIGAIATNRGIINKNYYPTTCKDRNRSSYPCNKPNQTALNKIAENRNLNTELTVINTELTALNTQIGKRETELGETIKNIETETQSAKNSIAEQVSSKKSNYEKDKLKAVDVARNSTDLLARLEALGDLKSWGNPVWWASLVVTLLFVLLETAPVTVKLLSKRGPYDEVLDRIEYEIYIEQKKLISNLNDSINTTIKISTDKNSKKLNAELKANEELLYSVALAQAEIAKLAVEKWKQDEIDKIKNGENGVIINTNSQNGTPVV
jgi:hypothetical protein